ncbi:phage tail tube protein [Shewanella mangrovisoli]|uniref:phage tail tube protein n=1 Tax=Shewanella mangrovisoli TaxID=2864211 RepID=UPI0035B7DBB6
MSETVVESYIGSGIVYVAGRDVGNASGVKIAIEQETKTQPNFRGGGGNAAEITRVKAVKLSFTMNDFSNANMALALRGLVEVVAAGAVTDEPLVAVLDGLARTAFMIDTTVAPVVKNSAGDVTYVKDTDYVVSAGGIRALSSGDITAGEALKVSYTKKAGNVLQALTESGTTVPVTIDGVNDATGKPWVLDFYKWSPSPTAGMDLIGDDFGSFDIEGGVLADSSIVATGKSKFFKRSAA